LSVTLQIERGRTRLDRIRHKRSCASGEGSYAREAQEPPPGLMLQPPETESNLRASQAASKSFLFSNDLRPISAAMPPLHSVFCMQKGQDLWQSLNLWAGPAP
jgi:hypothetical protein